MTCWTRSKTRQCPRFTANAEPAEMLPYITDCEKTFRSARAGEINVN
jgi:hypothetical protein